MNMNAMQVRSYWRGVSPALYLDPEVLDTVFSSLTEKELADLNGKNRDRKEFMMNKIFNRHNDYSSGAISIEDGNVTITTRASITELDISMTSLRDLNRHMIYKLEDLEQTDVPGVNPESLEEAVAAYCDFMGE